MRNVILIAKREYLEQVRGRSFRLSTILLPLVFGGMIYAGSMTESRSIGSKHLAIVAASAELANDVRRSLVNDKDAQFSVDVVAPASAQDRETLLGRVQSKALDGLLTIETPSSGVTRATYTSQSSSDLMIKDKLQTALNQGLVNQRLIAEGMKQADADALLKDVAIDTEQINSKGRVAKTNGRAALNKSMGMAFLLTMTTLFYGLNMARSIIDEKTSRIFEVMLAVAKPDDLLTGKLIGAGAVGLTQIAIWVVAAALLAGSALAGPLLAGQFSLHFSWMEAVLFPLYFVLGFFLYSALFSGLAATCETAQELQMYMPLAAAPVWLSFGLIPLLLSDSNSIWAMAASLFPPTAPFVMMLRMGLGTVPPWQFAVSIALMLVSVWAVLWFSSRLYRVGILMYGKRATLPEILRWLRYSS